MPDVFISYSRRDSEFVRRLADSVSGRGKELWLDTEGIADGEVFPQAIRSAIEQSDAFLFVISPAAVSSSYCEQEVEYARELQKRIVPVLREPVPDPQLPAEIRARSWIPFTENDEFDASLERLVEALDRDLERAKEHTRWMVKAIEWDGEGREKSFLLRGSELKAAETWLAGSPEHADPAPTQLQREYLLASREAAARRQRTLVGVSLAAALVSVGLLVFALISRSQAESQSVAARAQALAAESQAQLANDPEISVLLAMRAVREQATPQTMFALRSALDASPLQRTLPSVPEPGSCAFNNGLSAAISPGGRVVAESACNGTLLLADAASGRELRRVHISGSTGSVSYDPTGALLAVGGETGVTLLDPSSLAVRARLTTGSPVSSIAFGPDGGEIAAAGEGGTDVWTLPDLRRQTHIAGDDVGSVAFSRDGRLVIVGAEATGQSINGVNGNGVNVYDARDGRLVHHITTRVTALASTSSTALYPAPLAVSPNGSTLAVGYATNGPNDVVSIYSTETWKRLYDVATIPRVEISALAFSPDGRSLAVGAEDGTAGVWSLASRSQIVAYDGQTAAVRSVAFTPDGESVLTASNDGTARTWRAHGSELALLEAGGQVGSATAAEFDGDRLTVVNSVVDSAGTEAAAQLQTFQLPGGRLVDRAVFKSGQRVEPDATGTLALLRSEAGAPPVVWSIAGHRVAQTLAPMPIASSSFSPGGSRLAVQVSTSETAPEQLEILDLRGGRTVRLQGSPPCGSDLGFAWSGDGRRIADGGFCGVVQVWNAATGRLLREVNEGGEISGYSLSPDGSRLLVGSWDSRATIWNVDSGRALVELIGHTRGIDSVAFSPNGSLALTASLDHTARLWNARTGHVMRVFDFSGVPEAVSFSNDGDRIAITDDEGNVHVWETCPACASPGALLALARPHLHDSLTTLERTVADQP